MSAELSRLAKYYIADLVNAREVIRMPTEWHEMYEIFHSGGVQRHRMPPPDYVTTKEFELCTYGESSADAVRYLFTEGPAAWFWFKPPQRLLSTIVEVRKGKSLT